MPWMAALILLLISEPPRWFEYSINPPGIRWVLPISPDRVTCSLELDAGIRWRSMKGSARGFSFRVAGSDSAPLDSSLVPIFKQLTRAGKTVQVRTFGRGEVESKVKLPMGGLHTARLVRLARTLVFVSARAESTAKRDIDRFLRSFKAFEKLTVSTAAIQNPSRSAPSVFSQERNPNAASRDQRSVSERVRKLCQENMADIAHAQLKFRAGDSHFMLSSVTSPRT